LPHGDFFRLSKGFALPKRPSRSIRRNPLNSAASSIGRWITTDHVQVDKIIELSLGFWNTVGYLLLALIIRCLGLLGSMAVIYLMVGYGLPWFFFGHF